MYRGGNWNNGANAGVFYLNGNNSRSNANTNIGFRAALALFVYFLRAKAQQKHQGKRDAFPGRQGQRYTLVLLCRWRPPGTPSKPRRLAVVCYAGRRGIRILRRGDRLQYWCTLVDRKPGKWYYLKLDVSKYFYRVDHRVLLGILRRKFPNEDGYLWLMETIINCDHTPFGLPPGKSADEIPPSERLFEVGMPIGNLTSQLLANVCLNELDQYIKHELKAHFYDRYMDDMALLYPDAATLNRWRAAIEKYLNEVLHLELNSKTTIGLVKHGITFVGCRIYPGYRKPTAQSVKKMKARMRYIAKEYEAGLIDFDAVDATMQSYFGLMGHCSTHGLQKWIEKNIVFKRKEMADIELPQEVTQWELNQF